MASNLEEHNGGQGWKQLNKAGTAVREKGPGLHMFGSKINRSGGCYRLDICWGKEDISND